MQIFKHRSKHFFASSFLLIVMLCAARTGIAQRGGLSVFVMVGKNTHFTSRIPNSLDDELVNAGSIWILPLEFQERQIEKVIEIEKWLIKRNFEQKSREGAAKRLRKKGVVDWYQYCRLPLDGKVRYLNLENSKLLREIEFKWLRKPSKGSKMAPVGINSSMQLLELNLRIEN